MPSSSDESTNSRADESVGTSNYPEMTPQELFEAYSHLQRLEDVFPTAIPAELAGGITLLEAISANGAADALLYGQARIIAQLEGGEAEEVLEELEERRRDSIMAALGEVVNAVNSHYSEEDEDV